MNKRLSKLTTVLVAVFLCLNFANADSSIKFGGWSKHLSDGEYNSFHRAAFISHNSYFAGYFLNSFYDDAFALGKTFTLKEDSVFQFNLHTGLVYGYRQSSSCYKKQDDRALDPKIICPMLAPEVVAHRAPLKPSVALFGLDALVLNLNLEL